MSIFNKLFGQKRTVLSPTFVKDFSKDNNQLSALTELLNKIVDGEKKDSIERDIKFLKYGLDGENNVYFELKNSFLPILCLHDVRVSYEDYVAQLDFVVISSKFICILETKKLSGNISIDQDGNFIRTMKNRFGKEYKEGIYSPITQNKRHVDILKHVLSKELKINNMPILSLVVMANPKTIIKKYKCPAEIEKSLIKYDQIKATLEKYQNVKANQYDLSEKDMFDIANLLVRLNTPIAMDLEAKYQLSNGEYQKKDDEQLREELTSYRLQTSRAENIKAYYIFNNAEMEDMIAKYPRKEEELLEVKGFGKVKVEKYGEEILNIFKGQ
ncbi:NERD domain-containing protein [Paenibacillus sp. Marseille-P2973]|uniref:NERD domain-containing protein n=1 Tax=Paenibacillus sp. Marseille-P2973 TaxID=1871032 RepID=UPI001B36A89A|nr:NERD domain-containing protein [Paenibacillus sp. Marseille-P2973]MBQ4900749.1 NERD domain-containing protein [Paenibacillus sp. Marseille-P2973]